MYFHILLSSMSESNICLYFLLVDEPIIWPFIVSALQKIPIVNRSSRPDGVHYLWESSLRTPKSRPKRVNKSSSIYKSSKRMIPRCSYFYWEPDFFLIGIWLSHSRFPLYRLSKLDYAAIVRKCHSLEVKGSRSWARTEWPLPHCEGSRGSPNVLGGPGDPRGSFGAMLEFGTKWLTYRIPSFIANCCSSL